MKTQILIDGDKAQIVFTPETEFEKLALSGIKNGQLVVTAHRGEFAPCRGGYYREFDSEPTTQSLMLVISTDTSTLPAGAMENGRG